MITEAQLKILQEQAKKIADRYIPRPKPKPTKIKIVRVDRRTGKSSIEEIEDSDIPF